MARTVIHEESGPAYVDDRPGPATGVIVGVLLAVAVLAVAVFFMVGALRSDSPGSSTTNNNNGPVTGGGGNASAPAQPQQQQPSAPVNPTP